MKVDSIENASYVLSVGNIDMTDVSEDKKQKGCQQLSDERLALIRQRIKEKFYDQDEILNEVAGNMLKSPKLQSFLKDSRKKG
ncbi:MAG: hypothetical protein ACRBF0_12560 [Calditrichia bacterium]